MLNVRSIQRSHRLYISDIISILFVYSFNDTSFIYNNIRQSELVAYKKMNEMNSC